MKFFKILSAFVVFTIVSCILTAAETPSEKPEKKKEKKYPEYQRPAFLDQGDAAPDFSLPGVDGKTHKLADYAKADVLVVVFTCNHCPTSQYYEKPLIKLTEDYKSKNVAVVAISPNDNGALRPDEIAGSFHDDSFEHMKLRAKEMKYNFPYLYDGKTQKTSLAYGATHTPHIFVFDKQRKLRYSGAVSRSPYNPEDGAYTRIAIDAILKGEEINIPVTRPFGCSVKWGYKREAVDEGTKRWNARNVLLEEIDAEKLKKMAGNKDLQLRMLVVWSMKNESCTKAFADLIYLRRIYEFRPLELITINCDPVAEKEKVHEFLKKHHASSPGPSRFKPYAKKDAVENFIFKGEKKDLLKAIGQEKAESEPCVIMVAPEGKILFQQAKKLEIPPIRKRLVELLRRRR